MSTCGNAYNAAEMIAWSYHLIYAGERRALFGHDVSHHGWKSWRVCASKSALGVLVCCGVAPVWITGFRLKLKAGWSLSSCSSESCHCWMHPDVPSSPWLFPLYSRLALSCLSLCWSLEPGSASWLWLWALPACERERERGGWRERERQGRRGKHEAKREKDSKREG